MTEFSADIVERVLAHMNDDHNSDSLTIAKAYGYPGATAAQMTTFDSTGGTWQVTDATGTSELRIEWPAGEITERPEIRREIVAIYDEALSRLGLPPREAKAQESGAGHHHGEGHAAHGAHPHGAHGHGAHGHGNPHANPHGAAGHPHGTGHPGKHAPAELPVDAPFSAVIRHKSWGYHSDSEGAGFMSDIMRGISPLKDYIDLVVQHFYMYEALEEVTPLLANDATTKPFISEELLRMSALEADLEHLVGADWRAQIQPVAAVAEYAARIRECGAAGDLPGIVAHHYTRYLGDLSGGQMIAKRMRKQHGFEHAGVEFYEFNSIPDLTAFKNDYRANLDALGESLDDAGREKFLDEVRIAYEFNTEVFNDLAAAKSAQTA